MLVFVFWFGFLVLIFKAKNLSILLNDSLLTLFLPFSILERIEEAPFVFCIFDNVKERKQAKQSSVVAHTYNPKTQEAEIGVFL